jgi:FkbM family methyltransferase
MLVVVRKAMNIKMRLYRLLTIPLKGRNMDRYPTLIKLHNYFVGKVSNEYIDVNGYKMLAGKGDWLHFQYTGEYEPLTTKLLSDIIKPGDVVVDVGANIGYYTLLFSRLVGNAGKVYAFEPDPTNYGYLLKNIELNGYKNIIAEQKAASDVSGKIRLFLHETNPGGHTITNAYDGLKSIDVKCVTLEKYFNGHMRKPIFIKIDVEGAEDRVLRGAGDIVDGKTGLLLEFNTDLMVINNIDGEHIIKSLRDKGYGVVGVNEKTKKISERIEFNKGETVNILCYYEGMVVELRKPS